MSKLSEALRQRREALGFTLRDVERITSGKVSNAYLSQVETGKIEAPSVIMLHRLSAAYALDFSDLVALSIVDEVRIDPICPTCGGLLHPTLSQGDAHVS